MEQRTRIKVYITKTKKFRARVEEPGEVPYEVTVGGVSWNGGKGRKHEIVILKKCHIVLSNVMAEFHRLNGK